MRAVIIGASGGIGAAMAARLAADDRYEAVFGVSRTGRAPDGVAALKADITDAASLEAAAATVGAPVDLCVVASGVLHDGFQPERSWRALDADHLQRDFAVNAMGPALAARAFLPLAPREGRAVFAALSARVGSIGDNRLGGWHSYRASKAALNMILKTLSVELARTHPGMICVGLHPGTVDTALSEPFQKGVAPEKLFQAAYSATRLLAVVDVLTPADSGFVFDWKGERIAE
ncbi:MAG: SDR family NAD(P)-dependent oxidoreductase [Brevundimonas sp.]|uniref:SDR family NAD(P)-dependent oxidoreductase n=1 Tax=Brevundimonas sp. TaxID=1871086 RepID=UPI00391D3D40